MKNLKRVLALVTVFAMLLSVSAFAADGDEGEEEPEAVVVVISTNEESTEDDKSVTIPAEDDNGAAVMEAIEDIHDAIDNAADGSTVTITVGEDGKGTLVNDGEGVLEAWADEAAKNDHISGTTATLYLDMTYWNMGLNNKISDQEKIEGLADEDELEEQLTADEKLLAQVQAEGKIPAAPVGENLLEVPTNSSKTVIVKTNGALTSEKGLGYNSTIAAPVLREGYNVSDSKGGVLVIDGGTYTAKEGANVINLANGTVQIKNGSFSGAILVTGELTKGDTKLIANGGTLIIDGGVFSEYSVKTDCATAIASRNDGFTATEGTVQISGGSFDSVATLKNSYLVTDAESGLETILVYQRNGESDNMYTAVARSSLVDAYDLTAHETEGQATYYTITLKVVNEETGEEEIIEAPVYFYDDYSDDSSDDDTPAAPAAEETIEEEATPLAALPEDFTVTEEQATELAVDLGIVEAIEEYVPETVAEHSAVAAVVESLTAGYDNADAAAILAEAGINEGDEVSREQFATVIFALATAQGYDVTARADLSEKFTDAEAVSAFAQEALAWAVEAGIYQGVDVDLLDPQGMLTYEQLILVVSRYLAMISAQ